MESLAERIAAVRERIDAAAHRAGRNPQEVTLVVVTKTHPPALIAEALDGGAYDLGENRIQEAEAKIVALEARRAEVRWHLIGHLQRNKAKRAVTLFDLIHSLDSLRLAETLNRQVAEWATEPGDPALRLPVLLQVNVSGEASKEGFDLPGGVESNGLPAFLEVAAQIQAMPQLYVAGLMTIAPLADRAEQARPVFRNLRHLRDYLAQQLPAGQWEQLSMGMTDDFEVAIEEGATIVRVGRAIFGERSP